MNSHQEQSSSLKNTCANPKYRLQIVGHFDNILYPAARQVAVKRIPDVLSSPEQAKRVLREICILRRLVHPFIIGLKNAFVQPSATGLCHACCFIAFVALTLLSPDTIHINWLACIYIHSCICGVADAWLAISQLMPKAFEGLLWQCRPLETGERTTGVQLCGCLYCLRVLRAGGPVPL